MLKDGLLHKPNLRIPDDIRAAVYVRLAKAERHGGPNQEADCRDLCARLAWPVTDVYVDQGPAESDSIPHTDERPEFARMLADLRNGDVNAVATYHLMRLSNSSTVLNMFDEGGEFESLPVALVDEQFFSNEQYDAVARLIQQSQKNRTAQEEAKHDHATALTTSDRQRIEKSIARHEAETARLRQQLREDKK